MKIYFFQFSTKAFFYYLYINQQKNIFNYFTDKQKVYFEIYDLCLTNYSL